MTEATETNETLELEVADRSVKRYQRLKLMAEIGGTVAGLAWLLLFALAVGPPIGQWLNETFPDRPYLQLWVVALALGLTLRGSRMNRMK